ncbi:MAG TPA: hypothetical protein VGH43_18775 [Jatrophihabitans sp.]|jgi:hypothetical protein
MPDTTQPDTNEPVYRSLFIVEVFTVGPFEPYAEMDHYDGEEAHTAEGRDLSEILSDTYEHGIPTRYYQIAAHPVPDSIGEWAEMTREQANVVEMGYGYRDGVPYGLSGEEPIEWVAGVVDIADLWRYRSNIQGGPLQTCSCGYPITLVDGRWEHLFNMAVITDRPAAHDADPGD